MEYLAFEHNSYAAQLLADAEEGHGAVLHGGQVVPLADGVHPAVGGLAILPPIPRSSSLIAR